AVALGGASCDGQAQAVAGSGLARGAEEGFAKPGKVLVIHAGAVIANGQGQPVGVGLGTEFDGHAFGVETQGIAQQVVQRPFEHVGPAAQGDTVLHLAVYPLVGRYDARVFFQLLKNRLQADWACRTRFGVEPCQFENFTDKRFQAVAFLGQSRPDDLAFGWGGAFGQGDCDTQSCQWRAQLMGDVAKQLALAADQALQASAHAVEILGQHAQLVATGGQSGKGVLLIGGLPQVVHRAAQAIQWAGDVQRQKQAEAGQYDQRNAQGAQRPEQAVAMPGLQLGIGDAVDEQVGFARQRTCVVGGQASPRQTPSLVLLAGLEGGRAGGKGATYDWLAVFGKDLYIDMETMPVSFQHELRGYRALAFIDLGPDLRELLDARMTVDDPGVLIQCMAQQNRQPGDQGNGQPECGKNAPEQGSHRMDTPKQG